MAPTILAADDNENALFVLSEALKIAGYNVITASDGAEAIELLKTNSPDLILSDLMMPNVNGYELAKFVKADPKLRYVPVVLVTSRDDMEDIVQGFECGADDYIKKPYRKEELLARIRAAMRTRAIYQDLEQSRADNQRLRLELQNGSYEGIIGKSSAMKDVYTLIEKIKGGDVSVLITGESGTGKELIAHAIHSTSERKDKPFVVQNCSAFNDNLLESELFGHVKGAFTGATSDKQGLFETADGGSFFLDELGEMSLPLQAKLLRVLQDGTFLPVGATKVKHADVRVIAATNRNLPEMIKQGTFREDLYYRLNVVNITLPPLRDRKVDIQLLCEAFLQRIATRTGKPLKKLSDDAVRALTDYNWPGNVRELQNEMERAVLMSAGDEISFDDLSPQVKQSIAPANNNVQGRRLEGKLKDALESLEANMIEAALERNAWNKSEAARELGISRSSLISKVATYNLEK